MVYQSGKKPVEPKNAVHVKVVVNEPEHQEPKEVSVPVRVYEPKQKEETYTEKDYIGFINYLLEKMNLRQLSYILGQVNTFFYGGYFEQPPEWTKKKNEKEIIIAADKLFDSFDEDVMSLSMIRDHLEDCVYAFTDSPTECDYESALKTLLLALDPVTDKLLSDAGDQYEGWKADCKKSGIDL